MAITVSIELLSGSYEASDVNDRERAEWPPNPARVFCALVAAARGERDRAALEWLESQPAPVIVAAPPPLEARRAGYVVVNTVSAKGGNQSHPGRTNGLRVRTHAIPTSNRVTLTWPEDAAPELVDALDTMARRIPYLGRSTGVALVAASATDRPRPTDDAVVTYEPCALLDREFEVRVPYPGFLAELDAQFAADRPAWEVSRYQGYRRHLDEKRSEIADVVVPSVYTDLIALRFAGLRPQAHLAARFSAALRAAVLGAAGDHAPQALHGHGADGRPHVAFLALPDVGATHSDGHLLGLAVAVPDLPDAERRAVLAAVGRLRPKLRVPGIEPVELLRKQDSIRPWGASPDRWRRGSKHWASATPVVLDRYPKKPDRVEAELRTSLRMVGLPEPTELQISSEPLLAGAARLRPADLPPRARGRLYRHVAVTFERRVSGPVVVGAGRYLGVGLLAPVRGSDD